MNIPIFCEIIKITPDAALIDGGTEKPVWVPRSLIEEDVGGLEGDTAEISIPEWLAVKEGLV